MLGNHLDAKSAFEKGLELDPSNEILKSGLKSACDRLPADEYEDEDKSSAEPVASTAGIADMLRNMGGSGAGGGGGMPDIASMMKNPMMMQMAQKMMENGGLEKLMENPSVMNMVCVSSRRRVRASLMFRCADGPGQERRWTAFDVRPHVRSHSSRSVSRSVCSTPFVR